MNNVMEKTCKPWHVGIFLAALMLFNLALLAGHARAAEPPLVHEPVIVATESHKKLIDYCLATAGKVLTVNDLYLAGFVYNDCMARSYTELRKKSAEYAIEFEKRIKEGGI